MVENKSLESITKDTCVSKYAAMRSDTPGFLDACRSCISTYYVQCERYKPIGNQHSFFRSGLVKLRQFYQSSISIDSLPHDQTEHRVCRE